MQGSRWNYLCNSLSSGREGSSLIHCCHYPNAQDRAPTDKTLIQSFGVSSMALLLSPLGRAIWAALYHGRAHSRWHRAGKSKRN